MNFNALTEYLKTLEGELGLAGYDCAVYLDGGEVTKDHVIPVSVVDATNVNDFRGFGDAVAAE